MTSKKSQVFFSDVFMTFLHEIKIPKKVPKWNTLVCECVCVYLCVGVFMSVWMFLCATLASCLGSWVYLGVRACTTHTECAHLFKHMQRLQQTNRNNSWKFKAQKKNTFRVIYVFSISLCLIKKRKVLGSSWRNIELNLGLNFLALIIYRTWVRQFCLFHLRSTLQKICV